MDPTSAPTTSDRLPGWLAEALDVLSARRRLVVATAVGLLLLGAIVSLLAPSILPPRAVVGAAVGIAAALLATAVALALDASDLVVRGARHVRAAGGTVDIRVGRQHDDVGPLLAAVARHAGQGPLRVALAPASRSAGVPGPRASALAEALARTGRRVLLTDLTRGGTPAAGLSDVISGARTLSEVVRFEEEMYLARLAVGSDPDLAIRGFADWVDGLPSDLEILVAALPPLAETGVLAASASLDATFVLVEVDRTERVDLIASLDAVDAAGLTSEVVLVDPDRTPATGPVADDADDADNGDTGEVDGADGAPIEDATLATADWDDDEADEAPVEPTALATADGDDGDEDDGEGVDGEGVDGDEVPQQDGALPFIDGEDTEDDGEEGAVEDATPSTTARDGDVDPDAVGEIAALLGGAAAVDAAASSGASGPAIFDEHPSADPDAGPVVDEDEPTTDEDEVPVAADEDEAPAVDEAPAPAPDSTDELDLSGLAALPAAPGLSGPWGSPGAPAAADEGAAPAPSPEPAAPSASSGQDPAPAPPAAEADTPAGQDEVVAEAPHPPQDEPSPARGEAPLADDAAALEVARTSAALQQLAQQIWERDER